MNAGQADKGIDAGQSDQSEPTARTKRGAGRTIIRAQDRGGRDTAAITKQHRRQRARAVSRTIQRAFGPRLDPVARSVDHRLGRAGRGPHHVPEFSAQRERARRSV
jgi:hypothetical protein